MAHPKGRQASPLRGGDRRRRELRLGSPSPPLACLPLGCADQLNNSLSESYVAVNKLLVSTLSTWLPTDSAEEAYYRNLAAWEGKPAVELVAPWSQNDVQDIVNDFRIAFTAANFREHPLKVGAGITNQSIGNKVAEFFVACLNRHLREFRIADCSGAGYPDKRLVRQSNRQVFLFELKATSDFDPNDSNRIVLTSSSEKLRRYFQPPVFHILATACYAQHDTQIEIGRLRLDFLEPTTPVNVRLEASVSQRILARAIHPNVSI